MQNYIRRGDCIGMNGNRNGAFVAELDGVADEIEQDLPEPVRISKWLSRNLGLDRAGDVQGFF